MGGGASYATDAAGLSLRAGPSPAARRPRAGRVPGGRPGASPRAGRGSPEGRRPRRLGPVEPRPDDPRPPAPPTAPGPVALGPARSGPAAPGLLRRVLPFYGVVILFAVGYALFSRGLGTLFGEQPLAAKGLAGALGIALGLVAVARVGSRAWAPLERASRAAAALLGRPSLPELAGLALLSGVAEELLFRGALWSHLGPWGTTLLFGLVHFVPRRSLWIYPLYAAAMGLFLGMLRQGTGHLVPCMLAHALVNGLNLLWITRSAPAVTPAPAVPPAPPAPPPSTGPAA